MVDLTQIPSGLNANETEKFVRENGSRICSSCRVGGPGTGRHDSIQPQPFSGPHGHSIGFDDIDLAAESIDIKLSA